MRNVILSFFSAFLLLSGFSASAQFATSTGKDTAIGYYAGGTELIVHNDVRSTTANPVYLKWHVDNSYFGTGWDLMGSGFCDNVLCYTAVTSSNIFADHTVQKSDAYNSGYEDFKMVFNAASGPATGSYAWVRVIAQDTVSGSSKTLTYIAYASSTGVTTTSSTDDIVLFPNPAREAVNVIFDGRAGVKTIAIYNLIGKLVSPVYRPSGTNNSAKIDINEMPAGVYFIRLMNAQGHVVATRRFVHQ